MAIKTPVKNGKSGSATLASLAKKVTEQAPAKTVEAIPTPVPAPVVEAFDWSTVAAPTVAVYARNTTVRKDLEADTPAFIKSCVTSAFEATAKNLDAKGKAQPRWLTVKLDTSERAEEFVKLAKRYATFKDFTMRGEANPAFLYITNPEGGDPIRVEGDDAAGYVRFCVKHREVRKAVAK